jgi:site-specific DNA recombinase
LHCRRLRNAILRLKPIYSDNAVENLHASLSDPQSRTEAAEILRSLVEKITVKHDKNGVEVELVGDIVKLVSLPEGNNVPASFESSVKVVAGRGFEPLTFRL